MPSHGTVALLTSILCSLAPPAFGLGVLLPLYVYPNSDCGAWSSVNSAISAHSSTPWYIVVNPSDGPGDTDTSYQNCVASLASASSGATMGYINTASGNVESDIDKYAAWPSNARPNGIYFDPISPTSGQLRTYQGYVSYAKSKGFSFIGLDPGQTASDDYLALGDIVNTYEGSYSSFSVSSLSGSMAKQSVNLEQAPASGSYSDIVAQLESKGVLAVYITNEGDESSAIPAQLSELVAEVASANGGSMPGSTGLPSSGTSVGSGDSPSSTNTHSGSASGTKTTSGGAAAGTQGSNTSGNASAGAADANVTSSSGAVAGASGHHSSTAAIVGGILGALVVLLGLAMAWMCFRRRSRQPRLGSYEEALAEPKPFTDVRPQPIIDTTFIYPEPSTSDISYRTSHISYPTSPDRLPSARASSVGTGLPPSRAWAVDVKTPIPSESGASSRGHETLTALPAIPSSPQQAEASASRHRTSLLSAFSSSTGGSAGTAAPMYPGAQRESLPPPAYSG